MKIHVYAAAPIDFWQGWQHTSTAVTLARDENGLPPDLKINRDDFAPFFQTVKELAHELGWEGDMSQGPFVSMLPDIKSGGGYLVAAFKQSNNGVTFIGSQVELPYLRADGANYLAR
ncbi:hypothetical protein [Brevundimonas diminuta]|uniref:hypothetical protein n=1 Tax=Brevundimonas diminuta TaxID=293 RepID=UPI0030FB930E